MSEDILRHETVHEDREIRMTTEGDHVQWMTRLRNHRVAVCWYEAVGSMGERGWGLSSNRFVDHTYHRFLDEDEYKALLLAYIMGCFIMTSTVYFLASSVAKLSKPRQIPKVVVPVVSAVSAVSVVLQSFIHSHHLHRYYQFMAAGDSGSGYALILGLRRWVRSYRKGKGMQGRWRHKGNEVNLRLLPYPPGKGFSIHLMLASRVVYHEE